MPHVSMDEKAFAKGHSYVTLLYDLDHSTVEAISDGRDAQSGIDCLSQLSDEQMQSVEAIAIDGKQVRTPTNAGGASCGRGSRKRRSYDKASSKSAIPMVSAWATTNHVSLGQVVVDAKSNEITAIPQLLELLEISGCLVTIDAMGCQTQIAKTIVAGGADDCLAVKQNQPTLYAQIETHFDELIETDFVDAKVRQTSTHEKGHGREEDRYYFICPVPESVTDAKRWKKLRAIGMAVSVTQRGGKEHTERRYDILSRYMAARRFAAAVRGHWGIENSLHWQLDVTFGEDQCRVRKGHADTNLSLLRRTALSLLKRESTAKVGIKNKRLTAGWDEQYLEQVLFGSHL